MLLFSLLLAGLTIARFASALHGTAALRLRDVFVGSGVALWALCLCGLLISQFIQYFEEDSAEAEKKINEEHGINEPAEAEQQAVDL